MADDDGRLKKEFAKKDIERIRNLVKGKHGDKTSMGVGCERAHETHVEGDIWEEDGRKWTIKSGIKQNITKLDAAKKSVQLPLFCPECSNLMKNKYDKRFYIQYSRCFDCQINFEQDIKLKGLWPEYEKNIINSDLDNFIENYEVWIDDMINSSNENYITEAGDVESWVGSSKKKLLENKEETIKYLQSLKK